MNIDIELLPSALQAFRAHYGDGRLFVPASVPDLPMVGDEFQFPVDVSSVIFVVVKRRFCEAHSGDDSRVNLWLDVVDDNGFTEIDDDAASRAFSWAGNAPISV
jgi:hypothetical protein